jgi:hypothetical protein
MKIENKTTTTITVITNNNTTATITVITFQQQNNGYNDCNHISTTTQRQILMNYGVF